MPRLALSVVFGFAYFASIALGTISFPAGSEARLRSTLPFHGNPLPRNFQPNRSPEFVGFYVGDGVWDAGREHLKMFFQEHGIAYRSLEAEEILGSALDDESLAVLVMPGGESIDYLKALGDPGAEKIRRFVRNGGGYLGICAGAFYATSFREGGNATGPYGIGLLDGTAYDGTALKKAPFIEGMMDFDFPGAPRFSGMQSA